VWIQQKAYKKAGEVLAKSRQAEGITQVELAKKLRKPQSFVSNCEIGQRRIDVLELIRIAKAMNVDAADLFRRIAAII